MKNGFSLIELTVSIAIIGVLASIATPVYRNYVLRTNVTTQYVAAKDPLAKAIQEYIGNSGSLPGPGYNDLVSIGFTQSNGAPHSSSSLATRHIGNIAWNGSHIILQFANDHDSSSLQGKTLEVEVTTSDHRLNFNITGGSLESHLWPK